MGIHDEAFPDAEFCGKKYVRWKYCESRVSNVPSKIRLAYANAGCVKKIIRRNKINSK